MSAAVEFDLTARDVFAKSTDGRFVIDEMYPCEWYVFTDKGRRGADGQVSLRRIGPDHASFALAVAWVTGYVAGVKEAGGDQ